MSHHLDSPIARQDIRLDITDLLASLATDAGGWHPINRVAKAIAGVVFPYIPAAPSR